jgi:hypothetical protein
MARTVEKLDALKVKALKPRDRPYRISDGAGLLLEVQPTGAKVWLCRLTVKGSKRRDMGLGGFPDTSLKQARDAARSARQLARTGIDPIDARRQTLMEIVQRR